MTRPLWEGVLDLQQESWKVHTARDSLRDRLWEFTKRENLEEPHMSEKVEELAMTEEKNMKK